MAMRGGPRLQVGSAAWVAEERDSALTIAQSEIEEFSFSARNEMDWLNEHMAEIFSENQMNVAELFKTPGKLRGKTPRTTRKAEPSSIRVPLSNMFSNTPKGAPNPFAMSNLSQPRSPRLQIAEDKLEAPTRRPESPTGPAVMHPPHHVESRPPISLADSGYHGSQSQDTMPFGDFDKDIEMSDSPQRDLHTSDPVIPSEPLRQRSPSVASVDETFESANENQTRQPTAHVTANVAVTPSSAMVQASSPFASRTRLPVMSPRSPSPQKMSSPIRHSPQKSSSPQKPASPQKPSSPQMSRSTGPQKGFPKPTEELRDTAALHDHESDDEAEVDEARSPSDASSPIRAPVRSSLNFASLPAREPLASKKSLGGARMSRTSHLDFSRHSYFSRPTGGKSLGNAMRQGSSEDEQDDDDAMDVDDEITVQKGESAAQSKTYTQRLQDRISMLGQGQSIGPRPSKSLANALPTQQSAPASQTQSQVEPATEIRKASPKPKHSVPAPGAFPDDDEDDWIAPPHSATLPAVPRPGPTPLISNTQTSDVPEHPLTQEATNSSDFALPKSRPTSSRKLPFMPERTPKHGKSASVPVLPTLAQLDTDLEDTALKKTISVSNPALSTVVEDDLASSPPKSPTRSFRDNPLKQVRNKLSSLLKGSKGLIASSAAISAEGKSSLLQSPSTTKLGYFPGPSVESFRTADDVVYPDLSKQISAASVPPSPTRSTHRVEKDRQEAREKEEREREKEREKEKEKEREREREKEIKEAKRLADQMGKLEKAREKEREKARVFSKEQEKIAAMEKQLAAQKEQEKASQAQVQPKSQTFRTPGPPPRNVLKSPTKTVRATPHTTKGQRSQPETSDEPDAEMTDVTTTVPPPSIPRPTTASSMRTQGTKRPLKPTKEAPVKSKQAPTLIRVNTIGSQQPQFHPSNSVLSANLHDTLRQPPGSARPLNGKTSQSSLREKPSLPSFTSSVSSNGRPKALDMAAKRKEQEEREAQRKRDEERKREEERKQEEARKQEQKRRLEAAKKRADIEKAKQTGAPPPAARPQPNGPPDYSLADKAPLRPPSRLGSTMHSDGRLVNTVLSSTIKGPSKRPLQPDAGEESSRAQQQRAQPSFPTKEGKRMRASVEPEDDIDMMETHNPGIIKGAPVRPSAGFKKELPQKSMYGNAYPTAPPPSASRNLFKDTLTAQHNSHAKHPLDMAQSHKGPIPFAQNPNPAHKTPARPVGGAIPKSSAVKSAARSPRFQNGESIELPDIQTDDESDEDDAHGGVIPAWANSPALRAALMAQDPVDPMQVFGPMAPLNLEEVFNRSKDRFPKFRARTSSANWSGTDRLTAEDIRKDMAARDKMRREGGWSYELSRDMS